MDPKRVLHKFRDVDFKLNLKTVSIWLTVIMVLSFAIGGLLIWTTGISNDEDFDAANLQREHREFSLEDVQFAFLNIITCLGELTNTYPILNPKAGYQVSEEQAVMVINQPNAICVDLKDKPEQEDVYVVYHL